MYTKGKFVIGTPMHTGLSCEVAVLIPEIIPHAALRSMFHEITSAGFFHLDTKDGEIEVVVYGKSVGLGVEARCDDRDIRAIKRAIGQDPSF